MQAASGKSSEHFIKEKLRHKIVAAFFVVVVVAAALFVAVVGRAKVASALQQNSLFC